MKSPVFAVLCLVFLASLAIAEEKSVFKSEKEKISYSIGMDIGNNMKKQSIDIDPDTLAKGLKDSFSGGKTLLTEEEARETLNAFRNQMMAKQQEQVKAAGEKNKKEGEAFLAANKKKEGVKTTPSGLQYKIVKDGTGKTPKATDTVTVNYRGRLIDGTEFDSSYKRGQPATFPVNGVIKGWTEALQMMKEGAQWELFIPSDLAYGERGAPGGSIGPNSVLIFDVELISIK
ncbi:MAG: FKBP-type peptidyl-prolyl cis-trans isomerase N-terminal domain-containing protein [bacterium]